MAQLIELCLFCWQRYVLCWASSSRRSQENNEGLWWLRHVYSSWSQWLCTWSMWVLRGEANWWRKVIFYKYAVVLCITGLCDANRHIDFILSPCRYNIFTGCPNAKTCTIVLRGGAEQFMEETERSLHDAIMIVRRTIKNDAVVAGMYDFTQM